MKRIRHKKPYTPLTQQFYCCVPTCIQWILYRRGIKLVDQETIGNALGLTVPPEYKKYFNGVTASKIKPKLGYGTAVSKDCGNMNGFFKKYKIALQAKSYPPNKYGDFEKIKKLLICSIEKDRDVIAVFNKGALDIKKRKSGHAVIITEIIENGKKTDVIVGDPSFRSKKFWKIRLSKLIDGMDKKYDGQYRTFWIISRRRLK